VTSTYETLLSRLQVAFDALDPGADPVLRTSDRGDYQANGVMALAKRLGRAPRDVANEIVGVAQLDDVADAEVAGPGFLNLTLLPTFLDDQLASLSLDHASAYISRRSARLTVARSSTGPRRGVRAQAGHH